MHANGTTNRVQGVAPPTEAKPDAPAPPPWFKWAYAGAAVGLALALPTLLLLAFVFAGIAAGAAFQAFKLAAGLH